MSLRIVGLVEQVIYAGVVNPGKLNEYLCGDIVAEGQAQNMLCIFWSERLEKIRQNSKFGGDQYDAAGELLALKREVFEKLLENLGKEIKYSRLKWIGSLVLVVLGMMITAITGGTFGFYMVGFGIAFFLVVRLIAKTYDETYQAIEDFDKQYFDGEIMFHFRNHTRI